MKTVGLILVAALGLVSCDLLFNKDKDNYVPGSDIQISSLETVSSAKKGDLVTIAITVKNAGFSDVEDPIEINIWDRVTALAITTEQVTTGISRNDSTTFHYEWDTGALDPGEHMIVAGHNYKDENPANDSLSALLWITDPDIVDIAVTAIDKPAMVVQGQTAEVNLTVQNVGLKDAIEDFTLYLEDITEDLEIKSQIIPGGLTAGNSRVVTLNWNTQSASIGSHTLQAYHDFDDPNITNDSLKATITITEVPVTDISLEDFSGPATGIQGDNMSLSLWVENIGNQNVSSDIKVTLTDQTDGAAIGSKTVKGGLMAGDAAELEFTWNTGSASIGNHDIRAVHNLSDDKNSNNDTELTIFIDEPPFIDLYMASLSATSVATQGDLVAVSVRIENRGNRDITSSVNVSLTDEKDNRVIHTWTLNSGLAEGVSTVLNHNWDTRTATLGDHKLTATHNLNDDKSDNDTRSVTVRINEPVFLDIGITDVDAPTAVNRGTVVQIDAVLRNLGNRDINEPIMVTLADQTSGTTLGTQTLAGGMERDATVSLTFVWDTASGSVGTHRLVISHNYSDGNTANNSYSFDIELLNN